jgi:MYXO-CTERM domain-containing protein
MTRNLVCGGIALVLVVATGRADASPGVSIAPSAIGGNGLLIDGGVPGEDQFGYYFITNTGTTTLTVTNMTITGAGAGIITYSDPTCGQGTSCPQTFTVAPGAQSFFSLTCVAPQPGTFLATLTVTSDATSGSGTAMLTCKGFYPPVIQVTPSALDFGTQHICWQGDLCGPSCATQPATQTLTIANAAPDPSEVDLRTVLPTSASFTIATDPGVSPFSLTAGQSLQIQFTYHPAPPDIVDFGGPLTFTPTYPPGVPAVDVPFHAHGGSGQLWMDTTTLPAGPVGQLLTTTITAHDGGDSCLDVNEAYMDGTFTIVDPLIDLQHPRLLQSGDSITWTVTCMPTSVLPTCSTFWINWWYDDPESGAQYQFCCEGIGGALQTDPYGAFFTNNAAVGIGMSATQRLRVYNAGNQATDLVAMTPSDPHFTAALVTGSLPVTLAPGAETQIDVTFTPTETTRVYSTILLDGSNGDDYSLEALGEGVLLAASVTPSSWDFGTVDYPATPSQDFTITNTGERTLTVNAVSLDLPNDYTVSGLATGATIDPGASLAFSVRAAPSMLGQRRATMSIDLDLAPDLAIPIAAIASDPALVVTTADTTPNDDALDFGRVDVDVGPKTGHVTLHNAGATAITLATCAITGDPAFTLATTCPLTLAPGADVDLAVAFAPTAEADAVAALTVTGTSFATGALRIGLHGLGLDQHLEFSATSLPFPDTFRHPMSAANQTVTVRNTAATELALSAITVDGAGFALVGPTSARLAPSQTVDITVAFSPTMIGDFTGHLVIGNADDPQIARVNLTGRGIARDLAIAPLAIDLGTVTVGTTLRLGDVQPGAIAIRNADATATFTISSATLSSDPAFRLIGPDRTVLAPGEQAKLDLELTPTAPGALTAQIAIFADGDPDPVAQIAVTANAAAPPSTGSGCGCSTDDPASSLPLALGVAWLAFRRRRTYGAAG